MDEEQTAYDYVTDKARRFGQVRAHSYALGYLMACAATDSLDTIRAVERGINRALELHS